jgi:hypothetical protein
MNPEFEDSLYQSMVRHETALDFHCPVCQARVYETMITPGLNHFDCDCGYVNVAKPVVIMTPELWAGLTKHKYEDE